MLLANYFAPVNFPVISSFGAVEQSSAPFFLEKDMHNNLTDKEVLYVLLCAAAGAVGFFALVTLVFVAGEIYGVA